MYGIIKENVPPPRPSSCLLMMSVERRACNWKFDEWLLTDSTMMRKERKAKNLIC